MKELLIPDESVVLSIFRLYVVLFLVTIIEPLRIKKEPFIVYMALFVNLYIYGSYPLNKLFIICRIGMSIIISVKDMFIQIFMEEPFTDSYNNCRYYRALNDSASISKKGCAHYPDY